MIQPIAVIFMRSSSFDWYVLPIVLASVSISITARYWRFVAQWCDGIRGREWARVSAVIDVVSVVKQTEQTRYGEERVIGYEGTLTYFYRNPELQMGEYCRIFDEEDEAQSWASSYKGRALMVHVDPRDPTKSVLRKDEL